MRRVSAMLGLVHGLGWQANGQSLAQSMTSYGVNGLQKYQWDLLSAFYLFLSRKFPILLFACSNTWGKSGRIASASHSGSTR